MYVHESEAFCFTQKEAGILTHIQVKQKVSGVNKHREQRYGTFAVTHSDYDDWRSGDKMILLGIHNSLLTHIQVKQKASGVNKHREQRYGTFAVTHSDYDDWRSGDKMILLGIHNSLLGTIEDRINIFHLHLLQFYFHLHPVYDRDKCLV